jgi:hypothetical protein
VDDGRGCSQGQAAEVLAVTAVRVWQLRQTGKLKATRTAAGWIYDSQSLEAYRRERERRRALRSRK